MHKIADTIIRITAGAMIGFIVVIGLVITLLGLFEALLKRLGLTAVLLFLFVPSLFAQGVVTGQEVTISYSGSNATIVQPNTPATALNTPNGTNVFLIPIPNPSVSIRFYITNQTTNACSSALTAQLWAVSDPQTFSFNNSLANWQVIPLQDSTGNLTQTLIPSLPASGVAYFSSTAISSPRVALQLVNTTGGCATTNLEVFAVIVQATVTTPLISTNGPTGFNGTSANQVQGVISQEQNGTPVNPIVQGGLQLPLNSNLLTAGIDNFNSGFVGVPATGSGLFVVDTSPAPAKPNELAVAIAAGSVDTVNTNIISPWVCAPPVACAGPDVNVSFTKNPKLGTIYGRTHTNATAGQEVATIVLFSSPIATVAQWVRLSNTFVTATLGNGSAIIAAADCFTTSCVVPTPTDTQGNVYQLLTVQNFNNGLRNSSLWVFASSTLSTSGSDTITFAATSGTINESVVVEITGVAPATITSLAISNQSDAVGAQVVRQDAQAPNQFNCSVTISTNTTTQCQSAPTTIGAGGLTVPVRLYVTDIQVQTTTAGTTSAIQLKTGTGANCGTGTANLSAITYVDTVIGLTQAIGFRTPLIAPLQTAVCVTQTGAVAGTSTVELHGFLAP